MIQTEGVRLVEGDVSPDFEWRVRDCGFVAWDIETSGLDWRSDKIATCQLHTGEDETEIIQVNGHAPERLRELLTSARITKIFHHAPFDLRFMRYHWGAIPRSVACTKILSKIVHPELDPREHSLKPVLQRYLGVELDKSMQTSDWMKASLSSAQLRYAAKDVQFLPELLDRLMDEARAMGVADLVEATFDYLPTRVETDVLGCGDVFAY